MDPGHDEATKLHSTVLLLRDCAGTATAPTEAKSPAAPPSSPLSAPVASAAMFTGTGRVVGTDIAAVVAPQATIAIVPAPAKSPAAPPGAEAR